MPSSATESVSTCISSLHTHTRESDLHTQPLVHQGTCDLSGSHKLVTLKERILRKEESNVMVDVPMEPGREPPLELLHSILNQA